MMRRFVAVLLMLPLLTLASGCGTFCNTVWWIPSEGGQRVYGGVRAEAGEVKRLAVSPSPHETAWDRFRVASLLVLDLPLSAVGDTLTLPYVLWLGRSASIRPAPDQPTPPDKSPAPASNK
ncbi:YceK/YidQ family lipoprotein [Gemmata algarum]|uniref:YceK/YidQ family lipoprotein n=1 Tax=Gemmata algarum TaxID=2975278 RepID=UPI0039C97C80